MLGALQHPWPVPSWHLGTFNIPNVNSQENTSGEIKLWQHFLPDGHKRETQEDGVGSSVSWLPSTSHGLLFPIFYFSIKDGLICIWLQLPNICKPDSQGGLTSPICVGKQALSNLLTGDAVINKQEHRMAGDISSKTVLDSELLISKDD